MTDGKEIFVKIKAVNNGKYFDVSNVTLNVLTGFWKNMILPNTCICSNLDILWVKTLFISVYLSSIVAIF